MSRRIPRPPAAFLLGLACFAIPPAVARIADVVAPEAEATAPSYWQRHRYRALVVGVHDGDTITVIPLDQARDIRLEGIDAPELLTNVHGPADPTAGPSRDYLARLVNGRTVYVSEAVGANGRPTLTFGRHIGRVYVADGKGGPMVDAGAEQIRTGHATPYPPESPP